MMKTYVATGAIIQSFLNSEIEGDKYSTQVTVTSNILSFKEEFFSRFGPDINAAKKNPCSVIIHFTFQVPSKVPDFLQFSVLYGPRLE